MLVVSHVLPATDDPIGALALETRQGMVCAGPVRVGEPGYEGDGEPTVTFLLDPVGVSMELAHYLCHRVLSLVGEATGARTGADATNASGTPRAARRGSALSRASATT